MRAQRSSLLLGSAVMVAGFMVGCTADLDESQLNAAVTGGPDLVESALTEPPASVSIGGTFSVTDTATNQGTADAGTSTVRYYLSTDTTKSVGDKALTGSRACGAIAASASDSGTVTVTVPAIAGGSYYLIACSDADNTVTESDETNNCRSSTGTVTISGSDLVESAVSDPPANAVSGVAFPITDTVSNIGAADAGASTTYYYVSLDGVHVAAGTLSIGRRSVGAIAAGGTDTGTANVAAQGGTPPGTYYVLACADRLNAVGETNENNNCRASANTMNLTAPDLIEGSVGVNPTPVDNAGTLTITETVSNTSMTDAGASTTQFYLSSDGTTHIGWIRSCTSTDPVPQRSVPAVPGSGNSTGSTTANVCYHDGATNQYMRIPPGSYYIIACADELRQVAEISETNNCATSNQFVVTQCGNGILEAGEACDDGNTVSGDGCSATCTLEAAPDLVETAVSNPPASTTNGSTFSVTDTVTNTSTGGDTTPSTTRYYLSLDRIKSPADYPLTGSRAVPALNAGASSTGTVTVGVANVAGGNYYLLACADADNAVTEASETNNCLASTGTVTLGGADLTESGVSSPPATALDGASFTMTDTVTNGGTGDAAASTTWYYLSLDAVHVAPGTVSIGRRSVPALTAGSSNTGSQPVQVVAGTPAGTYYVLACADRFYVVPETNENNNCAASTTTMALTGPDLTETAMSLSSSSVTLNSPVSVTETVTNGTMTAAGSSTTRFYVSADTIKTSGDQLMRDCTTGADIKRAVPALAGSASSTGTTNVPLCYRDGTGIHHVATGSYFMLACADDGATVPETNESNNCASVAFTVTP